MARPKSRKALPKQSSLNSFIKGASKLKSDAESDIEDHVESDSENMARDIKKKLSPDQSNLPPIYKIPEIFADVVRRVPELKSLAQHLKGRKLRVATMCSGTESPLLALGLISNAMGDLYGTKLEVEHVFSCEIEPFKQAYIERNFSPPILFRDVCELGGETATTAYGAKVRVPGNVDILIAGTSCVDYSNLNNEKQDLDANGESGRTFRGMMSWVEKHRPPLVILENVCGAPWDRIADYFKRKDYTADHMRVDTKNYYIPHTRTRGYLVAVDERKSDGAKKWKDKLVKLARPASSTLDAFLLASDDPRIHQAREKLVQESKAALDRRREKIDWARCENRHQRARLEEALGSKRPLTSWSEGGSCKMLDFMWSDWGSVQVERVWDLMDITVLRRAKLGLDPSYKTQVWNLSQNVDRQIDSNRVGIAPCLTPTMIAYITNRGGPMVGLEALSLQGLPIDTLLLTRETQDQLADLAGNAMSTTVVGSAIISALLAGQRLLEKGPASAKASGIDTDDDVEMTHSSPGSDLDIQLRIKGDEQLEWRPLDLLPLTDQKLSTLVTLAKASARLCECEGRNGMTTRPIAQCTTCDHTSCSKCGGRPEHVPVPLERERLLPASFAKDLKSALPMCLRLSGVTRESLEQLRKDAGKVDISPKEQARWKIWLEAVLRSASEEVRFIELKRGENWIATYRSPSSLLELTLHPPPGLPEWRLTVFPLMGDPANATSRKILADAVARLVCKGDGLLDGSWDFALPFEHAIQVNITGVGPLVPSYEMRLGLQDPQFVDKKVFSQLKVALLDDSDNFSGHWLDKDITGVYQLLDKCGAANSSLHRQIGKGHTAGEDNRPLYFFLDPTRTGDSKDDCFVFSRDKRALQYLETREVIARLSSSWCQSTPVLAEEKASADDDSDNDDDRNSSIVTCHVPWIWVQHSTVQLTAAGNPESSFGVPNGIVQTSTGADACASAQALLSCKVLLDGNPGPEWPRGAWVQVDSVHELEVFKSIAYFTERVKRVNTEVDQWNSVALPDSFTNCERCAPSPPALRWVKVDKKHKAIEDSSQAGRYEQALKHRPAPFVTHIKLEEENKTGLVRIGINLSSLVHRAHARLPSAGRSGLAQLAWKLTTDFSPKATIDIPRFALISNREDPPSRQPPHFKKKLPLRPEQLRSLHWMIGQEADDAPQFIEEEVAEAVLPTLGWRAQGRAQRPVRVRGGVLADQVGYGKTAITLGLIDSTFDKAENDQKGKDVPGYIPVKATLVVVPPHLTLQWQSEVRKFTGSHFEVVVIHTASQLNGVTIRAIQDADVVVVASNLFHSDVYLKNLEAFAAGDDLPNQEGRYFETRLHETLTSLKAQVERLKTEGAVSVLKSIQVASENNIKKAADFVQKKRLKGKQYRDTASELVTKSDENAIQVMDDGPEHHKPSDGTHEPLMQRWEPEDLPKLKPEVVVKKLSAIRKSKYSSSVAGSTTTDAEESHQETEDEEPKLAKGSRLTRNAKRQPIIISDDEDNNGSDFEQRSGTVSDAEDTESDVVSFESEAMFTESDEEPPSRKKKAAKSKVKVKPPAKKPTRKGPKSVTATDDDGMEVDSDGSTSKAKRKAKSSKKRKSGVLESSEDEPAPKKAKKESKPKPRRAETDPWKLKAAATKSDFTNTHAPPLEMFHFHRLVIDEFTYLKGKGHSVVNCIQSTCRWILSGTPPIQDFASVKSIATFLGLHLGVDDDGEGSIAQMARRRREQTDVEKFHSFREVRTLEWHEHRQTIGQRFLNQFVRQNIAEIDEIPFRETVEDIHLPAAERAIYLELEHHLRALDMTIKKAKKSESDREKRLNKSLGDSHSAEEALLKRCSHFDLETTKENAMKACTAIVAEREGQLQQCKDELLKQFRVAFEQQQTIKTKAGQLEESYFEAFLNTTRKEGHGDEEATSIVLDLLRDAGLPDPKPLKTVTNSQGVENSNAKSTTKTKKNFANRGKQFNDEEVPAAVRDLMWEHREHTHELRRLVKELVARKRSLRFFTAVRDLQRDQNRESGDAAMAPVHCPYCGRKDIPLDEVAVLSACGHKGCVACVRSCAAEREACVATTAEGCKSLSRLISVVEACTLGVDDIERDGKGKHFGRKLEDIIDLIQNRIPSEERVLVFVQFDDLMKKVGEALSANKVKFLEIRGSASQKSKALEQFQNDSPERVLLLHVTDESASGANLTGANHAIFISPLLTNTQETYDACMTQAVGRLRRFGQLKMVHIYHFLSKDTIDIDIYEMRSGRKVTAVDS